MHQELVERRRWISESRFLHALNYCMVLPGPEAQQLATYIGWLMHRTWGGIVAGALFVLPSLFILIALSWIYMAYGNVPLVAGIFYGIKPAVTAIVLAAAWRIGQRALKHPALWGVAAAAFVAIFAFDAPFPLIVLGAGIIGYLGGRYAPGNFSRQAADTARRNELRPGADRRRHADARARALFLGRSWRASSWRAGLALWALAIGTLAAAFGWDGTLTQMGWFFTKAALLTFGGAYAVLPYVYQGAVENYGWLTAPADDRRPGAGRNHARAADHGGGLRRLRRRLDQGALRARRAGGDVVTFFTFLPSFIFIFMGAPFIETTHGNLKFTAPLTGITAAVVGVILNLALFFAWHVLWPQGLGGRVRLASALIGAAAFVALFRFKAGVIPVIGACAIAGLAVTLLR